MSSKSFCSRWRAVGAGYGTLIILSLVPMLGWAAKARACTGELPPSCSLGSIWPGDGETVPAGLAAIEYVAARDPFPYESDGGGPSADVQAYEVQLLSSSGESLRLSVDSVPSHDQGVYWLVPQAPLLTGQVYRVRFRQVCASPHPGSATSGWIEQSFRTGPFVRLPLQIGTAAQVGHEVKELEVPTASGSCTTKITAAVAHIELRPTPELRAYLGVSRLAIYSDGRPPANAAAKLMPPTNAQDPVRFDVYAGCGVTDPGAARGLTPGKHELELCVEVLGQTQGPPPLPFEIQLDCPSTSDAGVGMSDGGLHAQAPANCACTLVGIERSGAHRPLVMFALLLVCIAWRRSSGSAMRGPGRR